MKRGKISFNKVFFSNLYASSDPELDDMNSFLTKLNLLEISEDHIKIMDKLIGQMEIEKAINKLKGGKPLGMDGLTGEFYKKIKSSLSVNLVLYTVHSPYLVTGNDHPYLQTNLTFQYKQILNLFWDLSRRGSLVRSLTPFECTLKN